MARVRPPTSTAPRSLGRRGRMGSAHSPGLGWQGVGSLPPHYKETENEGLGWAGGGGGSLPPEPGDLAPSSPLPQERGRELRVKPEGGMHEGKGKPGADRPPAPQPTLRLPVTASLTGDGGELLN